MKKVYLIFALFADRTSMAIDVPYRSRRIARKNLEFLKNTTDRSENVIGFFIQETYICN